MKMNIATALNQKYIHYTIVMLTSLCENNPVPIDAYLLHSELTDKNIQYMKECLAPYEITLVPLAVNRGVFHDRFPRSEEWSLETYYRLFLFELLPPTVDRILYLDVDLIINKSLEEYYTVDFQTDEIITCADSCGKTGWEKRTEKQRQMFAPMIAQGYQYFNAGVMLLHVAAMRNRYHFDVYLNAIKEWDYGMAAPDQDILNYVHWNKVGYIDPYEYDLFARIAHNDHLCYETVKEKTAIIHFAGDKPWNTTNVHFDIEKIWWEYAALTPCYQTLLQEFMEDIFTSNALEEKIQAMLAQSSQAASKLSQLETINQKLMALLTKQSH